MYIIAHCALEITVTRVGKNRRERLRSVRLEKTLNGSGVAEVWVVSCNSGRFERGKWRNGSRDVPGGLRTGLQAEAVLAGPGCRWYDTVESGNLEERRTSKAGHWLGKDSEEWQGKDDWESLLDGWKNDDSNNGSKKARRRNQLGK